MCCLGTWFLSIHLLSLSDILICLFMKCESISYFYGGLYTRVLFKRSNSRSYSIQKEATFSCMLYSWFFFLTLPPSTEPPSKTCVCLYLVQFIGCFLLFFSVRKGNWPQRPGLGLGLTLLSLLEQGPLPWEVEVGQKMVDSLLMATASLLSTLVIQEPP